MNVPAIRFEAVTRAYRFFRLQPMSFELEAGQVLGLVGPNGAGKSTTIRLLMGLVQPDAGEVFALGHSMRREAAAAKADIGFVSDDMRLFGNASLGWHLAFMATLYPRWDERYARDLMKRFNLHTEQLPKQLSRGEHLKALLMLTLARHPRLIVLDEPTSGLDPVARHEMLVELMQVLKEEDRSILFSSHNTLDVERICDQIAFIDRGRLVDLRDKESFLESWRRVQVNVPEGVVLPSLPGVVEQKVEGRTATLVTRDFRPDLPAALGSAGAQVHSVQRLSLEEIFVTTVMSSREGALQ
ncbi:MAG: ABC transporter ATP-binding protein [Steroidobacteraceae bacterium]